MQHNVGTDTPTPAASIDNSPRAEAPPPSRKIKKQEERAPQQSIDDTGTLGLKTELSVTQLQALPVNQNRADSVIGGSVIGGTVRADVESELTGARGSTLAIDPTLKKMPTQISAAQVALTKSSVERHALEPTLQIK